jgi:hypothetical protein
MTVSQDYCFSKNSQIIARREGEETALIDPYRRTMARLNPVGSRVWELVDGTRSTASIIDIMKGEFEVEAERLAKDVRAFLKDLARREMIV